MFILNFWSYRKNGLIKKLNLIEKSMTLQPGQETVTMHILTNISQNKDNQTMKFGQLIENNKRNNFLWKY